MMGWRASAGVAWSTVKYERARAVVRLVVHLDDEVGRDVLGLRRPRVLVDFGSTVGTSRGTSSRPALTGVASSAVIVPTANKSADPLEVPGVDPLGVGKDEGGDGGLGVHPDAQVLSGSRTGGGEPGRTAPRRACG